ncbi:hypothetical protein [Streptomyces sp. NPDC057702]|uniref:hypothetical protein n=1 Tax=unclassified Streptomyces TaxID=2593676 RepID=UPI0036AD7C88
MDYQPKDRYGDEVEQEIAALSGELLDVLQAKGEVTKPGPMAGPCRVSAADAEMYRSVRHPWSFYGVDNKVLESAMDNLAKGLPDRGWKIVKNGPDASKNRNPEILAVHLKSRTQAEITWRKGLQGREPLISFAVYSRCFRDPDRSTRPAGED